MTYIPSLDFYAAEHYASIGHARRVAYTPRGEVVWSCGCGAKSRTLHRTKERAQQAHARHVDRATAPSSSRGS